MVDAVLKGQNLELPDVAGEVARERAPGSGMRALADQKAGRKHGFANPLFYANPNGFYDVVPVKTAVARRNFVNSVDASDGTVDRLRTFGEQRARFGFRRADPARRRPANAQGREGNGRR